MSRDTSAKLAALRQLLQNNDPQLHAYIIPSEDAHQSEYTADYDQRRPFISHFTGSAGLALVTSTKALLWTDGRYFLQAAKEFDANWTLMRIPEDPLLHDWLVQNLPEGSKVGVDPRLVSIASGQKWKDKLREKNLELVSVLRNLVDVVWGAFDTKPARPSAPIVVHPLQFAGETLQNKVAACRAEMGKNGCCGVVLCALDEVAWLLNLRGGDIPYNPVFMAYVVVTNDIVRLYVHPSQLTSEAQEYLAANSVEVAEYDSIPADLISLAKAALPPQLPPSGDAADPAASTVSAPATPSGSRVAGCAWWLDAHKTNMAIKDALVGAGATIVEKLSPACMPKACKNATELQGLRSCHVRDGVAICEFLAWIYACIEYRRDPASAGHDKPEDMPDVMNEISIMAKLDALRAQQELFVQLSFPNISAVDANAAIIHYHASDPEGSALVGPESMLLFDTGAQYLDGTTDVTRTLHFGTPTEHQREAYTRVLQGHIALDSVVFPSATTGFMLDILARQPLWQVGLDYRHGTGHGVGSYLCVHEGPHLISFRQSPIDQGIFANMTVTDEPGYYEDGSFGIRIENVLIACPADTKFKFGGHDFVRFEHITMVPLDRKLIAVSLLSPSEIAWINAYHHDCLTKLAPRLSPRALSWLQTATQPL